MSRIAYRKGCRYALEVDHLVHIDLKPVTDIVTPFIILTRDGELTILNGYAWDGASGPAIDTRSIMRAALVHDALYQLIREGHLAPEYRQQADKVFRKIYAEDAKTVAAGEGLLKRFWRLIMYLRAIWIYRGVRIGGADSADPEKQRPIYYAP